MCVPTWSWGKPAQYLPSTSLILRNISERREILAYPDFNYKSLHTFQYPTRDAWMYSTTPFTGYPSYSSRTMANFMDDALESLFVPAFLIPVLFLLASFFLVLLAEPLAKIHTTLLDQPLYRRVWEISSAYSRIWKLLVDSGNFVATCAFVLRWATPCLSSLVTFTGSHISRRRYSPYLLRISSTTILCSDLLLRSLVCL
jgi:hypothetical protein